MDDLPWCRHRGRH